MVITVRCLQDRLQAVPDPELPWVTIADLGILRKVLLQEERAVVEITPTWSGCPAIDAIKEAIGLVLREGGYDLEQIEVNICYSPAWSTDDITETGRKKLASAGIAPPRQPAHRPRSVTLCPRCESPKSRQVSEFGATPCKALMACLECLEPFDRFKEL